MKEKNRAQTVYHIFRKEGASPFVVTLFRKIIYDFYAAAGRDLPWRRTDNPYLILVSEIMLQQTQVERVIPKYILFTKTFPDLDSLAEAPTRKILELWQGLGYNRRALSLQQCAKTIRKAFQGKIPSQEDTLMRLPGIAKATASEIAAFAFNRPVVFIETNIRTVFLFFFFKDDYAVKDSQLLH